MLSKLAHFGLVFVLITSVFIMAVNAVFMLISPRAWFNLPSWLRLQGVLTVDRYGAGFGALQVRALGAIFIGTICWVLFDVLRSHAGR